MNTSNSLSAVRGSILHFLEDPGQSNDMNGLEYYEDGLLVVENGYITNLGPTQDLIAGLPEELAITDRRGHLIVPGFIDCHTHFVQTDIVASWGKRLLDWLENYTYPAEREFSDPALGSETARFFLDELLRNGTTTALVMGSVHKASADAFFTAAQSRNMRVIAGKVMMDRNCPDYLQDTPHTSFEDSQALIENWHGNGRLQYAISPRFAPTSSPQQLHLAAQLGKEYPDTYIHTHLAENQEELDWVKSLYPDFRSYLDVYDKHELLRKRTLMAHGIWLDDEDYRRLAATDTALVHCPTCNLFMGSGTFDLVRSEKAGVQVGLGTDIGGGTTFSMLGVLNETYKVAQLTGSSLTAEKAFFLATLGAARTLDLDASIGNFELGKEADYLVLDFEPTELLSRRMARSKTIQEKLFLLMMLGDDRIVLETYVMGQLAHARAGL